MRMKHLRLSGQQSDKGDNPFGHCRGSVFEKYSRAACTTRKHAGCDQPKMGSKLVQGKRNMVVSLRGPLYRPENATLLGHF